MKTQCWSREGKAHGKPAVVDSVHKLAKGQTRSGRKPPVEVRGPDVSLVHMSHTSRSCPGRQVLLQEVHDRGTCFQPSSEGCTEKASTNIGFLHMSNSELDTPKEPQ